MNLVAPILKIENAFTAAQIATALDRKPQSVRRQLQGAIPAGTKIVNGNETTVFALAQLPESLRGHLEDSARRLNYRSVENLLAVPRQKWEPALALSAIADEQIQAATKLREALRPWLVGQHDLNLSTAEMETRGV